MSDIKNNMKINKLYSDNFNKDGYIIIKNFLSAKINNKFKNALINNYKTHLDKKINKKNISEIISKYELENNLKKSSKIIECCVAFPIMVKTSESEMLSKSKIIKKIIESL